MKNIKLIAIILCLAMLLPALVACNLGDNEQVTTAAPETEAPEAEAPTTDAPTTELPTEEPTEEVTTEEPYDIESQFVSFITFTKESLASRDLTATTTLSGKFTIPEGFLEQINVLMGQFGDVNFALYKWDTNYDKTVAGEPIKVKQYLKSENAIYASMNQCSVELNFEVDEVGPGTYLYVISSVEGTENHASIFTGSTWSKKLPEEYAYYADFDLASYINGDKTSSGAAQANFVIGKKVPVKDAKEEPVFTEKDAEGTAKVILLGGQSNAEGVSLVNILEQKVGPEKFAEYSNGYSNVKIMYHNVGSNVNNSNVFVDAKAGQGTDVQYFGPELGLAEYLANNFPDEKFYIIKYAKGGSILETEWYNAKNDAVLPLLFGLTGAVEEGLAAIEAEGLTPKIVGFVWNQGESDAIWPSRSERYYDNLAGMVNYIRTTFADYASVRGIGFFDATIMGNLWNSYRNVNMKKYDFYLESPINFLIDTHKYTEITTIEENNDKAHYDALGMIKLGNLYGEEIAKIIK